MLSIWLVKFRQAWHKADDEGKDGSRVRAGLEAALPLALMTYSEWLDSEGLIVGDADSDDLRSHEQLVIDFMTTMNK